MTSYATAGTHKCQIWYWLYWFEEKWLYKLAIQVGEHLDNKYQNHIKIFTDGSVLDSLDSGAGFVIPDLKVQKSFYLGKGFSIFTSELYAILMALNYICNIQLARYNLCWLKISSLCIEKLEL